MCFLYDNICTFFIFSKNVLMLKNFILLYCKKEWVDLGMMWLTAMIMRWTFVLGKKMVLNSTLISTAQTLAPDSSKNPYCANPGFEFDNKAEEFWLHFLFRNGGAWSQAVRVFFSCCFKQ